MKSLLMFVLCVCMMYITACTAIPFPECNEHYPPNAKLTQIAIKHNVCLRDVGNGLIVANGIAIGMNAYTVEQADQAVDDTIALLNTNVTELFFQSFVGERLSRFPGLIEVSAIYIGEFNTPQYLDADSKTIIQTYLIEKVKPILARYKLNARPE